MVDQDDRAQEDESRFSVFEENLEEGKRSARHATLNLNFIEDIPKGIELYRSWNEELKTTGH